MPMLIGTRRALLGARAAFSPLDIPGLIFWPRADEQLYTDAAMTTPAVNDNDVVGAWADQSGNANHATQATTANKPLLKLAIINGKSVVSFDGVDDYLTLGKVAALDFNPTTDPFTIFIVTLVATDDTGTFISQAQQTPRQWSLFIAGNKLLYRLGTTSEEGADVVTNTPKILSLTCNTTNGNTWVDGSADIVGGGLQWTDTDVDVLMGARRDQDNTDVAYPLAGDIAEIIVYDTHLSTADRQSVEAYLSTRYAISLS